MKLGLFQAPNKELCRLGRCGVSAELVKPGPAAFLLKVQIPFSVGERGILSSAGDLSCQLLLCILCDKSSR